MLIGNQFFKFSLRNLQKQITHLIKLGKPFEVIGWDGKQDANFSKISKK